MDEENYKALLERLDEQDRKIEALEKKNSDLVAMNRALIGRTANPVQEDKAADIAKLGDKLDKGLKHGTAS